MTSLWSPIENAFHTKRHPVGIVDIAGDADARLARALLEGMGAVVRYYHPGTPGDFLKIIAQETEVPPYLIVCAHGHEGGIYFGDFCPEIDTSMLHEGSLPPATIAQHAALPECVILGLFCDSGDEPMAKAFLAGQAKAYIGVVEPNPDSLSVPLFLTQFFYELWRHTCSPQDAWARAAAYDDTSRMFVYWDAEGKRRIPPPEK